MRAWAIKHWLQGIYVDTVSRTRHGAIECFMQNYMRGSAASRQKQWRDQYPANKAIHVARLDKAMDDWNRARGEKASHK